MVALRELVRMSQDGEGIAPRVVCTRLFTLEITEKMLGVLVLLSREQAHKIIRSVVKCRNDEILLMFGTALLARLCDSGEI